MITISILCKWVSRIRSYSNTGISLLEMLAILAIAGVLLSSIIPICIDRINRAKYEKMINEMTSIAQACIDFYNSQYPNAWPDPTRWASQLAPSAFGAIKYLDNAVTTNPWGNPYVVNFPNNPLTGGPAGLVTISTTIPLGIAQDNPEGAMLNVVNGTVSIARSVPNEGIGMVQYEKKYIYKQ